MQPDFCRNRQLLADISEELDGGAGADTNLPDAAELLAHARAGRDLPGTASSAGPARDIA